ncbi:hypothetical protein [Pedobacter panaciterrae]|uniref:hypothetical protein n=1 Tax=Pedobacter panaciterrae TaxID=363849 RepID=UPI002591FAE8|nr:hypothetical protein [uncultured Pedobacter sp.]
MNYHNYFVGLEDRFIDISKYVEVDELNYGTFSSELALLYMSVCSEFEVVSKELCSILDPQKNIVNINSHYEVYSQHSSNLLNEIVVLGRYNLSFKPFELWTDKFRPEWWTHYNKVKHNRTENYHLANLGNVIQSLCALQAVNYYFIWKKECPTKSRFAPPIHMALIPNIFKLKDVGYSGPFSSDDVFEDLPEIASVNKIK